MRPGYTTLLALGLSTALGCPAGPDWQALEQRSAELGTAQGLARISGARPPRLPHVLGGRLGMSVRVAVHADGYWVDDIDELLERPPHLRNDIEDIALQNGWPLPAIHPRLDARDLSVPLEVARSARLQLGQRSRPPVEHGWPDRYLLVGDAGARLSEVDAAIASLGPMGLWPGLVYESVQTGALRALPYDFGLRTGIGLWDPPPKTSRSGLPGCRVVRLSVDEWDRHWLRLGWREGGKDPLQGRLIVDPASPSGTCAPPEGLLDPTRIGAVLASLGPVCGVLLSLADRPWEEALALALASAEVVPGVALQLRAPASPPDCVDPVRLEEVAASSPPRLPARQLERFLSR